MMLTTMRVAFRNISRQKKRSFLLVGAIAFGMLVITLLNALTGGVVENLRVNFSHALGGHVFIIGREFTSSGQVILKIAPDERLDQLLVEHDSVIESLTKRSRTLPTLIFGSKQTMQLMYGVDFLAEDKLLDSLVVTDGSLEPVLEYHDAIILPKPSGERLGVQPGETILVKLETLTGQQNVGEFRVAAFIEDQEQFGISAAYAHRTYLNSLLNLEADEYQVLNMFLTDLAVLEDLARDFRLGLRSPDELEEEFAEVEEEEMGLTVTVGNVPITPTPEPEEIRPWDGTRYEVMHINQIMEPVEQMVGVLNKVALVIFLILLVVTMVGITNTFRMIMIERTREIGTMRAFGMQKGQVRSIFLWEAAFLGILGSLAGVVLGGVIALILGSITFNADPSLQFFLNHGQITFTFAPASIVFNLCLVVFTSLLAAYRPATAAARLSPLEALSSHT